jgi:sec-independent protein translocase protein TatC
MPESTDLSHEPSEKATSLHARIAPHIRELRNRACWVAAGLLLAMAGCYTMAGEIFSLLAAPLMQAGGENAGQMMFTHLAEGFVTHLKIACYGGLMVGFPLIAWHVYRFAAPGLYAHERRAIWPMLVASPLLFAMGAWLAYGVVFPAAWSFFLGFEESGRFGEGVDVVLQARVGEYLGFCLSMMLGFGLAFQMPLMLIGLMQAGLVSPAGLASKRRHAVVVIFLVAAILTPPDILSQIALAIPLMLLYEGTLLFGRFSIKKCKDHARYQVDS